MPPSRKGPAAASVLSVTPECAPLVKTGGLGDVSAALPAALRAIGVDARVLLPGYPSVLAADPAARELAQFTTLGAKVRLLESRLPSGVPLLVLDCPPLYVRGGGPYQKENGDDWEDNALRFGVLSRVAAMLGTAQSPIDWRPDVIQCHDWPTALAPVYLRFSPAPRAATLTTIHNIAFQGSFPFAEIDALELPAASRGTDGVEFYGRASFLKGALMYSDAINTVSPTYAREIQTPELGFGLDGVLRMRSRDLYGVLNGIDTALWNPATDPWIPERYDANSLEKKAASKRALKKRFALGGADDIPLAASVGRLAHQKGIDVLVEAIARLAALPLQLVVIGAGDRGLAGQLNAMHARHPGTVGVLIGFDEGLAHLAEAGADMFLMPSRFEPCGMNQMYSQRYGTPPVAHATGGLVDTVKDFNPGEAGSATGFLIHEVTANALVAGVRRAVAAYRDHDQWRKLQRNGMAQDFGWESAAKAYAAIYARITPTS